MCCGHQTGCWDHCVQVEAGRGHCDQVDVEAEHCDQSEAVAGGHCRWCHLAEAGGCLGHFDEAETDHCEHPEAELRCQADH